MSNVDFEWLRQARATRPEAVAEAAARRLRRPLLGADGRLMIVAADHPARGSLGVRQTPDAMVDRPADNRCSLSVRL